MLRKESPFSPLYRLFQAVKMGLQINFILWANTGQLVVAASRALLGHLCTEFREEKVQSSISNVCYKLKTKRWWPALHLPMGLKLYILPLNFLDEYLSNTCFKKLALTGSYSLTRTHKLQCFSQSISFLFILPVPGTNLLPPNVAACIH